MLHWSLMSPVGVLDLSPLISKMFVSYVCCPFQISLTVGLVLTRPFHNPECIFFCCCWEIKMGILCCSWEHLIISHYPQTLSDMMYSWLREWLQAVLFLKHSIYSPTFDSSVHSTFCQHTGSFPVWLLERCSFPQSSFWIANFSSEGWIHALFLCVLLL